MSIFILWIALCPKAKDLSMSFVKYLYVYRYSGARVSDIVRE